MVVGRLRGMDVSRPLQQQQYGHVRISATATTMWLSVLVAAVIVMDASCMLFHERQVQRQATNCISGLSETSLLDLTTRMSNGSKVFRRLLPNILIPRVPGTAGNLLVREFIKQEMSSHGWHVEEDIFTRRTPIGDVTFSNVIATFNPSATRRVVVACHYDSKYIRGPTPFVGAIDSAVPCSVMIDTARQLNTILAENSATLDLTLQFIFFDGEEAFVRWTPNDSLYGSRHLARLWEDSSDSNDPAAANNLENIEFFVLMDLIGTSDTQFSNNYQNTSHLFSRLVHIESCLRSKNLLARTNARHIFNDNNLPNSVEDDHIPFIHRGIPVVHLISTPFPRVWHTVYDNLYNLDHGLIDDFSRIFRVFLTSLFIDV